MPIFLKSRVVLLGICFDMLVWRLFLAVPWGCLQFVIVVYPNHTHLLFLNTEINKPHFLRDEMIFR